MSLLAQADAFRIPLPDESVHCIVTSPPYWGLRKYAGEQGEEPLGLEPTPERHIERTVQWAREVYRVLRDDGVFWLNYGDCYAGGGNLLMMPHRIALALQQDGWIVRQDLPWSKSNPMPESVTGRRWERERRERSREVGVSRRAGGGATPETTTGGRDRVNWEYGEDFELRRGSWRHTRAHEYVFMLVKHRGYWADQEAVREENEPASIKRYETGFNAIGHDGTGRRELVDKRLAPAGRNPRSVLNIPTSPYKGAHYATFPPALIAPLITATCPRWACPVCGQGWAPVVEHEIGRAKLTPKTIAAHHARMGDGIPSGTAGKAGSSRVDARTNVLGHRPTCDHEHTQEEAVPGIVLDPFVGSGTTVAVARQLLRRGIGLDISRPYLTEQALLRTGLGQPPDALEGLPLLETLTRLEGKDD